MTEQHTDAYQQLCDYAREVRMLETILHLLYWDERTGLPPAAGEYRADQIAYVAGLEHQKETSPK